MRVHWMLKYININLQIYITIDFLPAEKAPFLAEHAQSLEKIWLNKDNHFTHNIWVEF